MYSRSFLRSKPDDWGEKRKRKKSIDETVQGNGNDDA